MLYRKRPEIIFDVPQRIQTTELPVALIIKDSHKFPVYIKNVKIEILQSSQILNTFTYKENQSVVSLFFSKLYTLDVKSYTGSYLEIKCTLDYRIKSKNRSVVNNNYPFLKPKNMSVYIDPDKRPLESEWKWGDVHCHSHYTEDQVEFGLPLKLFPELGKATGMSFAAITDHSYDLDDGHDSWTGVDPDLAKWHNMQKEVSELNSKSSNFTLLPGEEVSTDNGKGKTVHMVVINPDKFYPGCGDSFEKGVFQKSKLRVDQILSDLNGKAIAFAAHPFEKPSLVQNIFLNRDVWNTEDSHSKLAGFQIVNGKRMEAFRIGKKEWVKKLLQKQRKYIYAGNDSHGFLNRFISIHAPLISLNNSEGHIFSEMLTAVRDVDQNVESITQGLKQNPVIISSGPFLNISIKNSEAKDNNQPRLFARPNEIAHIGETLEGKPDTLKITAKSTNFFGKIDQIKSYISNYEGNQEVLINTYNTNSLHFEKELSLTNLPWQGYIRSELTTRKGNFALTNPVWFEEQKS
ncbi:MAG TPA: hypothetical protein VKP78_03755 [bacterium]|nr:hypothetical protein [bacterium]